jgi:hypothetical protein
MAAMHISNKFTKPIISKLQDYSHTALGAGVRKAYYEGHQGAPSLAKRQAFLNQADENTLFFNQVPARAVVAVATAMRAYLDKLANPDIVVRFDEAHYQAFYLALHATISAMPPQQLALWEQTLGHWAVEYVWQWFWWLIICS